MNLSNIVTILVFYILITMTFFGITGLIISAFNEGVYFHNIDLSYNMAIISNDLCQVSKNENCIIDTNYRNWRDRYSVNNIHSYTDFYIEANDNMRINFFKFGYYTLITSCGLFGLVFLRFDYFEKYKKIYEVRNNEQRKLSGEYEIIKNGKINQRFKQNNN